MQVMWPGVNWGISLSFSCFIHQWGNTINHSTVWGLTVRRWEVNSRAQHLNARSLASGSSKNFPLFWQMRTFLYFVSIPCLHYTIKIQLTKFTLLGYWPSQGHTETSRIVNRTNASANWLVFMAACSSGWAATSCSQLPFMFSQTQLWTHTDIRTKLLFDLEKCYSVELSVIMEMFYNLCCLIQQPLAIGG